VGDEKDVLAVFFDLAFKVTRQFAAESAVDGHMIESGSFGSLKFLVHWISVGLSASL
jgi:hypothetical protein